MDGSGKTTSANCLQPNGENDNGWDQGLLFLNPAQVWLQPSGYVMQMRADSYLPQAVQCGVTGDRHLDACATASLDGRTVAVQVVNLNSTATPTAIRFEGFTPTNSLVAVTELAGSLAANNPADRPQKITPVQTQWPSAGTNAVAQCTLAPYSFTVMTFQGVP